MEGGDLATDTGKAQIGHKIAVGDRDLGKLQIGKPRHLRTTGHILRRNPRGPAIKRRNIAQLPALALHLNTVIGRNTVQIRRTLKTQIPTLIRINSRQISIAK